MSLIGIVGKNREIQLIKKYVENEDVKIIEITEKSIKNLKNIKFSEIIIMEDIKIENETYKYLENILSKVNYLIINGDINIQLLKQIKANNPIKLITYGFNQKATITISSVKEDKIILCLQREIEKENKKILETQEMKVDIKNNKKVYSNIVIFIIKQLHNL